MTVPLHDLPGRTDDVPSGEVWVHSAFGYRSSIAASMIDRPQRTVVRIDDEYDNAGKLGLTT